MEVITIIESVAETWSQILDTSEYSMRQHCGANNSQNTLETSTTLNVFKRAFLPFPIYQHGFFDGFTQGNNGIFSSGRCDDHHRIHYFFPTTRVHLSHLMATSNFWYQHLNPFFPKSNVSFSLAQARDQCLYSNLLALMFIEFKRISQLGELSAPN